MKSDNIYRKALITGASAGLGMEYARQLAAAGANLILVARRENRLEQLAAELSGKYKVQVEVLPADLSRYEGIEKVAEKIRQTEDLDLLINNAGFGSRRSFYQDENDETGRMIMVHILATVLLIRAALPGMIKRKNGTIINVSSVAAFSPLSGAMYSSTKAFLTMFSENLQTELYDTGIKIQALCPGLTHTEFHEVAGFDKEAAPGFMWMTAEKVVRISLRALARKKVIIVPGGLNKFLVFLMRCPLTYGLVRWAARQNWLRKKARL
ncbi:MAG: SDR family oxidoreductase [Candidatus Aminicenantes bacterium]|jgi:short-subunit dehydrogenase|nr:SDR family oxidoreductase [Candidatus Aminicenantes bacterium]